VRAELLDDAGAATVRALLKEYTQQRIEWYSTLDGTRLAELDAATARTQDRLWSAIRGPARAQQTPVTALVVSGMNDVLNAQGYTQAAWWNRIPPAGWLLMTVLAFCANVLVGMGSQAKGQRLIFVLPVILALAFLLIADIDSPRRGLIAVTPRNLLAVAQSLGAP
jgi:hypothetical protein